MKIEYFDASDQDSADILIYGSDTEPVEAYHRQVRKVIKTKASFPNPEAARKLLFLATHDTVKKWTTPFSIGPPSLTSWLSISRGDYLDYTRLHTFLDTPY